MLRSFITLVVLTTLLSISAQAQILEVAELNTEQIQALDRDRTVVLLPGGILEEHGPYLPSFTDGYQNEHRAQELAEAIAARAGWTALVFPTIPLGSGGANQIGEKYSFPGTYAVRPATLRAIFMDLADELGEQGFRWIFIVHGHGSPDHNHALHEAGAYFRDTYGGRMVHLAALQGSQQSLRRSIVASSLGLEGMKEEGVSLHAGVGEHSRLWALRPDLVAPGVRNAAPVTAANREDHRRLALTPEWPGYFGSPARASSELGEQLLADFTQRLVGTAMWILDGGEERGRRRFMDINPVEDDDAIMGPARQYEAMRERRQREWLATRPPSNGNR